MERVIHEISPVYDENSKILILGSFPSVKSRENKFFYGHPQNRFWKVMAAVMETEIPVSVEGKKEFLLKTHVAVWDVIASCTIEGSSDSSIKDVVPNDLSCILQAADIRQIYCNGGTSYRLFCKYCEPVLGRKAMKLPSTSPANASYGLDRLVEEWKKITTFENGY